MVRSNPVVRPHPDGGHTLVLRRWQRSVLAGLFDEVDALLDTDPGNAALGRLHPPAYLDDPERDAGYQLLAGDELRSSHRSAAGAARAALVSGAVLTDDDLWGLVRSLNVLVVVLATVLQIDDEDAEPPRDPRHPDASRWAALDLVRFVQFHVGEALAEP